MVKAVKDFKIYILGVELLLAVPFSDCDFFVSMFVVKSKAAGNSNSWSNMTGCFFSDRCCFTNIPKTSWSKKAPKDRSPRSQRGMNKNLQKHIDLGGGFIFWIFIPTWGNDPIWLICLKWVGYGWFNHQRVIFIRFFSKKTSGDHHPGMVLKPCKYWGKNKTSNLNRWYSPASLDLHGSPTSPKTRAFSRGWERPGMGFHGR